MIYTADRATMSFPLLYRQPPMDENLAIGPPHYSEQENGFVHPPLLVSVSSSTQQAGFNSTMPW